MALFVYSFAYPGLVIAQEVEEPQAEITVVETGDIEANVDNVNNVNENDTEETSGTGGDQNLGTMNQNDSDIENNTSGDLESGENEINNSDGASLIDTGDVQADVLTENQTNANFVDSSCGDDCPATSSDEVLKEGTTSSSENAIDQASTTVNNLNNAITSNDVDLSLGSGDNSINGGEDATIVTGDVGIINIIINYINTNFFGTGKEYFINVFNSVAGSIDLSAFGIGEEEGDECSGENCTLNVNNDNDATIDNNIVIDVKTGANMISSTSGEAYIETGDINVVNDVLNIANLNVTGDDWFFAVVNIFGELEGDIILPAVSEDEEVASTENVLEEAVKNASTTDKQFVVANENAANVLNNIVINTETGSNTLASATESVIVTGDTEINNNLFNLINYNITGNSWKFARVNVFGNWEGFIQGLPDTYSYIEDENGITIYNSFLDDFSVSSKDYVRFIVGNNNEATTTNNIEINATTGENSILDNMGISAIVSGGISIANNLLNFINSNFSGENWEFSMVNVFGDWQGNLSFGQPDLWIVESIDKTTAVAGDYVTYTFLFGNKGDATAHDVELNDFINDAFINIIGSQTEDYENGVLSLPLGDIPPNTQGSMSYTVQVKPSLSSAEETVVNEVYINGIDNERDYTNNRSGGQFLATSLSASEAGASSASSGGSGNRAVFHPNFSIIKSNNSSSEVKPGDTVDFKIVIQNIGNEDAFDVLVLDVLKRKDTEEEISSKVWDLNTVQDREEIVIEYSLEIKEDLSSGVYVNEVMVEGWDDASKIWITAVASSKIKVDNDSSEPVVLGVEGKADLSARKIWPNDSFRPGDEFDYSVIVKNNGNIDAVDVQLTEILPDDIKFVDFGSSEQTLYLGNLGPGIETSVVLKAKVLDYANPGEYESDSFIRSYNDKEIKIVESLIIEEILADVEVAEITEYSSDELLSPTGFSIKEFVLLISLFIALYFFSYKLKQKYLLRKNEFIIRP